MHMISDPIKDIIQQIRNLDIQAKQLHDRRVDLVHKLETAIDVPEAIKSDRSSATVLFRRGDRIVITNRINPATVKGELTEKDRRGTVLRQETSDSGQVKVYFCTDSDIRTHRLAKNIQRVSSNCTYEVARNSSRLVKARFAHPASQQAIDTLLSNKHIQLIPSNDGE